MDALEHLKSEHRAISLAVSHLAKICEKLAAGQDVDLRLVAKLLEIFRGFVDKCHYAKEEGLLFPALADAGMSRGSGVLAAIIEEHLTGRALFKEIDEAFNQHDADTFLAKAQAYIGFMPPHIEQEETVLFTQAAELLGAYKLSQLGGKLKKFDADVIGTHRYQCYMDWIEALNEDLRA
jgi:hemerythrin-like domain-containing protein